MKRILLMMMTCTLMFCLVACGNTGIPNAEVTPVATPEQDNPAEEEVAAEGEESKANRLVVYFSATGNTRAAAVTLAELQGADLYEIVPEQPYTEEDLNYNDRSTRATVEQSDAAVRPAISGSLDQLEQYDVIYVGYPIWWGDMPRILYTFFDTYDLTGKTIAPFCTSGGSGLSGTTQRIVELEPEAVVLDGLHIGDSSISDAETNLNEWVSAIGLEQ